MSDIITENNSVNTNDPANTLPTIEEFQEKINQRKSTFIGRCFPIIGEEVPRLLVSAFNYFLIGFVYAFLRLYKDKVINNFLEASAVDWLKPITTVASIILVGVIQSLMTKYGINKGVSVSLLVMSCFMFFVSILIFFKDTPYLQPNPLMGREMFIGKTAELRGVAAFKCSVLIINNWIMSLFYIVSEVFGSTVVSYLYCTYMSYNTVGEQNGRFLRILYIGANLALLASGVIYEPFTNHFLKKLSYAHAQIAYTAVFVVASMLFVLSYVIMQYNNKLFEKPLFIQNTEKSQKTTKKKVKTGIVDGFVMAIQSKLLMAMCAITLFYNFSNAVNSALTKTTYKALANYYAQNPSQVPSGGEAPKADSVQATYSSCENKYVALIVIAIMIIPVFSKLFNVFGVGLFGAISIGISAAAGVSCLIFSMMNYQGDNNGAKPIFGLSIPVKEGNYNFYAEAIAITVANGAIKVGKYAFFDIIKESISMKIDLSHRSVFKSVFDGVFGKLGKSAGSGYGIGIAMLCGKDNARYYAPATGIIVIASCIPWALAIYYLHFNYKRSVENDSYMNLGFSKGYNSEQ